ncbi:hypothetical protein F4818DRAFT_436255 [Hypoxylon cercidicola]|nr:hypothetical protein F4818DRAFT_436255 [Hypoxylon cercidicola]
MRIPLAGALAGVLFSCLAGAASRPPPQTTLTLRIPSTQQLPSPQVLPATTHATLTALGASYDAPLTTAGAFVFRNVTPGSYLADVHCGTHAFAPLRVDVVASGPGSEKKGAKKEDALAIRAWETYRGNDWENKGQEVPRSGGRDGGFAVRVLGAKEYFIERGAFSVFGILKNPMILMGLVSMVLFIGLPKLVENMDPEMRAEFEEQQKKSPMASLMGGGQQPGAGAMGNFDMAAYMAGQGNQKDEGEPTSSNNGGGKKSGKR